MIELSRTEQLRSDTLATIKIAGEMVQALSGNLQEIIDHKEERIRQQQRQVAQLEAELDSYRECRRNDGDKTDAHMPIAG